MIAPLTEPFLTSDRDVRTTSVIGASGLNHSRIVSPGMNKDILSRDDVQSTVWSDVGKADKLNTAVQRFSSDKCNAAPSQIVEGSPKSIFTEIVEESNSSERMNLAKSLGIQTPKLVLLRHPPMQTDNVGDRRGGGISTRIADQEGIWRPTDSDIRTAPTHDDVESISEKLAYWKFIKDLEFETRELFERKNIKNIGNIETRLETTRLEKNQMTQSVNSSKCSEKHEPEVNLDPDPSSSD